MVQAVQKRSALRAAGYREAGHTVAALDHGQRIRRVSIALPADSLGAAYLRSLVSLDLSPPISPAAKELLEGRILTILSGPMTERWFRGRLAGGDSSAYDGQLIDALLKLHRTAAVASAYLEYLRAKVGEWLASPVTQRSINLIATALVTRRALTSEQARNLWQQAKTQAECRHPEPIPFPV